MSVFSNQKVNTEDRNYMFLKQHHRHDILLLAFIANLHQTQRDKCLCYAVFLNESHPSDVVSRKGNFSLNLGGSFLIFTLFMFQA